MTALATEVFLGDPSRFATGNQVASYIGMIPSERTSGKRQRLGKMSKQGNALLRYLWTEAAMSTVRKDPELQRFYRRKLIQKGGRGVRITHPDRLLYQLYTWLSHHCNNGQFTRDAASLGIKSAVWSRVSQILR